MIWESAVVGEQRQQQQPQEQFGLVLLARWGMDVVRHIVQSIV
eukprot:CAMPEP_0115097314 /NCGR_PEP_ID=MMETSP0227-20121206/30367_1 /TAXON_ID=89957 /ORGANISM="Polarella glacialis, Strain CCMP 1383" /LENGTH=42 /DNA_ID= /DNA_START= /DNA_END= /DNA_ORIENTATION=